MQCQRWPRTPCILAPLSPLVRHQKPEVAKDSMHPCILVTTCKTPKAMSMLSSDQALHSSSLSCNAGHKEATLHALSILQAPNPCLLCVPTPELMLCRICKLYHTSVTRALINLTMISSVTHTPQAHRNHKPSFFVPW